MPRRSLSFSLIAVALVLLAAALAGCGDSAAGEETQAYTALLHGLQHAAITGDTYHAARKANDLEVAQKETIHSFCDFAWQIRINGEEWKLGRRAYIATRLKNYAEYDLTDEYSSAVDEALKELQAVIDVGSLNATQLHRYSKACFAS